MNRDLQKATIDKEKKRHLVYHMFEDLSELRIRMIRASLDIIISEFVPKPFIKLLQYLAQSNGIHLDEKEKP